MPVWAPSVSTPGAASCWPAATPQAIWLRFLFCSILTTADAVAEPAFAISAVRSVCSGGAIQASKRTHRRVVGIDWGEAGVWAAALAVQQSAVAHAIDNWLEGEAHVLLELLDSPGPCRFASLRAGRAGPSGRCFPVSIRGGLFRALFFAAALAPVVPRRHLGHQLGVVDHTIPVRVQPSPHLRQLRSTQSEPEPRQRRVELRPLDRPAPVRVDCVEQVRRVRDLLPKQVPVAGNHLPDRVHRRGLLPLLFLRLIEVDARSRRHLGPLVAPTG